MVLSREARERIAGVPFDLASAPARPVEACNLCGGRELEPFARADRYGYAAATSLCPRCGLVCLDPMPTEEAYADFYRRVYRPLVSAFHGRRIDAETVEADQAGYAREVLDLLGPHLRPGHRTLLDVGGSTGVVAEAVAARAGLRATVLDPAPDEAARAEARGLEAVVGTIEAYDPGETRFDVVLLCQTIDHLLDVSGALAKLRALVAADGLLFVDAVDFRVTARREGSVEAALKVDHPYSLTPATTEAFLARAGFRPVEATRAADGLHAAYVCAPDVPRPDALPDPATVEELRAELGRGAR